MKRTDAKSHCPINFTLEAVGDPWALLVFRDIVYFGKHTYGEFLTSNERITTNILANRLASLEMKGIISKKTDKRDGRKGIYFVTDKGLDLIPVLLEMEAWGGQYDPSTVARPRDWLTLLKEKNREEIVKLVRKTIQTGGSIFYTADSTDGGLVEIKNV